MNIERLTKDEMISHASELVSSQDKCIRELQQQRQVLVALSALIILISIF